MMDKHVCAKRGPDYKNGQFNLHSFYKSRPRKNYYDECVIIYLI